LIQKTISTIPILEDIEKPNGKFRDEPVGPEVNADPMSLNLLAGAEGLSCQTRNSDSIGNRIFEPQGSE